MSRRSLLYLVLFLCMGVIGRELPECMSLEDDVSNDGDVAVCDLQPSLRISSRADPPQPPGPRVDGKGSPSLIFLSARTPLPAAPVRYAGVGLLRLLDQQRC
jgi:hypothetical protein